MTTGLSVEGMARLARMAAAPGPAPRPEQPAEPTPAPETRGNRPGSEHATPPSAALLDLRALIHALADLHGEARHQKGTY